MFFQLAARSTMGQMFSSVFARMESAASQLKHSQPSLLGQEVCFLSTHAMQRSLLRVKLMLSQTALGAARVHFLPKWRSAGLK
jgi:hypothetical protein